MLRLLAWVCSWWLILFEGLPTNWSLPAFGGWLEFCYLEVLVSNVCGMNFSLPGCATCTKLPAERLQEFSLGASDKDRCSGILEIFLPTLIILSCNPPMSQHYFVNFWFWNHSGVSLFDFVLDQCIDIYAHLANKTFPVFELNFFLYQHNCSAKLCLDFRVTIADHSKSGLLEESLPQTKVKPLNWF